ncbi:MAG: hypothetical protein KAV99_07180, partial [Candidatus Latescibacteria bacterium]|nr:hypothetical protein [Candidatus Latescibacterota bacterium]
RIVQYLATTLPEELQRIGEPIERTFGELESPVEWQDPRGNRVTLFPVPWPGGMRWRLSEVEVPGIWRLFSQNREVEQIAVNVDARESAPQKITERQIKTLLGDVAFRVIPEGRNLKKEVERSRFGREIWRECLLLALILLAAEMAVAFTTTADRK